MLPLWVIRHSSLTICWGEVESACVWWITFCEHTLHRKKKKKVAVDLYKNSRVTQVQHFSVDLHFLPLGHWGINLPFIVTFHLTLPLWLWTYSHKQISCGEGWEEFELDQLFQLLVDDLGPRKLSLNFRDLSQKSEVLDELKILICLWVFNSVD